MLYRLYIYLVEISLSETIIQVPIHLKLKRLFVFAAELATLLVDKTMQHRMIRRLLNNECIGKGKEESGSGLCLR
jgi:hypothetical protein